MILQGKDREITLTFKASSMEKLGDEFKGNTQFELQTGAYKGNLKILVQLLRAFCSEFKSNDQAFAFIDEMLDNGQTVKDIYTEIFNGINEKGFFTQTLEVTDAPPVNMNKITEEMMSKMTGEMINEMMMKQIGEKLSESPEK